MRDLSILAQQVQYPDRSLSGVEKISITYAKHMGNFLRLKRHVGAIKDDPHERIDAEIRRQNVKGRELAADLNGLSIDQDLFLCFSQRGLFELLAVFPSTSGKCDLTGLAN